MLGVGHFDVRQLARRTLKHLVHAEIMPRRESHRQQRVGAALHDQRGFAAQIGAAQIFSKLQKKQEGDLWVVLRA